MILTIQTILDELAKITDQQVAQTMTTLDPVSEGEKVYFKVQSQDAKRLWALSHEYDRRYTVHMQSALVTATTWEQKEEYEALMSYTRAMSELTRDIAWTEMRGEAPDSSIWRGNVAVRENFTLVLPKPDNEETEVQITAIPVPKSLVDALRSLRALKESMKQMGVTEEEGEEDKKLRKKRKLQ